MSEPKFRESTWTHPDYAGYLREVETYFESSPGSTLDKIENFAKYVPAATLARFLTRYEIFRRVLRVQGSIVECGVLNGGGLLTWAHLSSILEPANHQRRIVGFDTFAGFVELDEADRVNTSDFSKSGGYGVDSEQDVIASIALHDRPRFLGHIEKTKVVRGE